MKYQKTTLENGLRLVTVPMKDNSTVTVLILVEAGSHYEDKKNNGLSHFLEHMCFKGTEKRDYKEISFELDSIGAQYNAFTSEDFTGYYAKAHYSQLSKITEILSDIYLNSTIPQPEIEKERGVIIEEINMYEDLPARKVYEVFNSLLYGDSPAGRPIIGPKENIKKFNQEDFLNYRQKHYIAPKTTVVVAGNFDPKQVKEEVKKYFADLTKEQVIKPKPVVEKQKAPAIKLEYKKSDQSHLILGFRTFDIYNQNQTTLDVLAFLLGKGMSSRLFSKMRDEMGICYYVRAGNSASFDTGYLAIRSGVNNKRLEEAVAAILEEIRLIRDEEVSAKELKKVKNMMISELAINLETSESRAEFFGEQETMHQKIKAPKDLIKEIRAVSAKDLQKIAKQIFRSDNINLAVIGPTKDSQKLKKYLKL